MSRIDYKARRKQRKEEIKARKKENKQRAKERKARHKINIANINKTYGENMAGITESHKKSRADIAHKYATRAYERDASYKENKIFRKFERSKQTEKDVRELSRKYDRIQNTKKKNYKKADKAKQRKYRNAEEVRAFKTILIDAKYNRSCRSTAGRLFALLMTVGIMVMKIAIFFATELTSNQDKASAVKDTIFSWTQGRSWVSLLIVPVAFIAIFIINALPAIHDKIHELVSGVATVFIADLLVVVPNQNPVIIGAPAWDNAEYIAAVIGVFVLITFCFFATSYAPLRSMFTQRKQKQKADVLMSEIKAMESTNNPNAEQRNGFYNIAMDGISGGFFASMINIIIVLFSVGATAVWLMAANKMTDSIYNISVALFLVLPSAVNLVEISTRPLEENNLLKEFINTGSDFLEKTSGLGLFFKNIIPSSKK